MNYYDVLRHIHQVFAPQSYLEIGVRNGASLALAPPRAVACGIDPEPDIKAKLGEHSHIYACTSDEFFERFDLPSEIRLPLDLSFIDGMHFFENALQDFINTESLSHKDSIIILHDTFPKYALVASRERTMTAWTGDLFKMVLLLKKYRPDLEILHFDTPPAGLCLIKNLDPASELLRTKYNAITREFLHFPFKAIEGDIRGALSVVAFDKSLLEDFVRRPVPKKKAPPKTFGIPPASRYFFSKPKKAKNVRCLGVLLCYNDADILSDTIEYLLSQNHALIAWDHGSTDETASVLDTFNKHFIERRFIPRDVDFYVMYQLMSRRLIANYIKDFDVISWPDQDEILEGPFRDRSYYEYLTEFYDSPYSWIRFNNMNYWYSMQDDMALKPTERIRRYSHFPNCSPRVRAWRAEYTNIRIFNHNSLDKGLPCPIRFNLRHYPCRSHEQMLRRITVDRADLARGKANFHYEAMKSRLDALEHFDAATHLHLDDGKELNRIPSFDWLTLYGPEKSSTV